MFSGNKCPHRMQQIGFTGVNLSREQELSNVKWISPLEGLHKVNYSSASLRMVMPLQKATGKDFYGNLRDRRQDRDDSCILSLVGWEIRRQSGGVIHQANPGRVEWGIGIGDIVAGRPVETVFGRGSGVGTAGSPLGFPFPSTLPPDGAYLPRARSSPAISA